RCRGPGVRGYFVRDTGAARRDGSSRWQRRGGGGPTQRGPGPEGKRVQMPSDICARDGGHCALEEQRRQ
ncbi:unnamed protein product, partial [Laminaria digitata]